VRLPITAIAKNADKTFQRVMAHALRHTAASLAIASGQPERNVKARPTAVLVPANVLDGAARVP
jgi:hypothetical protein